MLYCTAVLAEEGPLVNLVYFHDIFQQLLLVFLLQGKVTSDAKYSLRIEFIAKERAEVKQEI